MAGGEIVGRGRGDDPAPRRARLGRALTFATLLALPLVFTARTVEVFEFPKTMLLTAAGAALGALLAAGATLDGTLLRRARGALREPVALGVLLFLASAAASTAASISPHTSLHGHPIAKQALRSLRGRMQARGLTLPPIDAEIREAIEAD